MNTLTVRQINKMKHAIGFDGYRIKVRKPRTYNAYRNRYITDGSEPDWDDLVGKGLACRGDYGNNPMRDSKIYSLTQNGLAVLGRILDIQITEGD